MWPHVTLYLLLLCVSLVPLMRESLPPLVDYPNHLGRMHLLASPSAFYEAQWAFLPNLAMDATVAALAPFMPIELAGRVFLALTIALVTLGTLALHHQIHGQLTAWPYVVFLFTYNRILLWGFVNYVFGIGLTLLGLAFWLRVRDHLSASRVLALHAMAVAIFLAHLEAFGVFGLSLIVLELGRPIRARRLLLAASAVALPVVVFAATRPQLAFHDIQMGSPYIKAIALAGIFRSYEPSVDAAIAVVLGAVVVFLTWGGRLHVSWTLCWPLFSVAIFYVLTPQFIFQSETSRLALPLVLLVIAASRVEWSRRANRLALVIVIVLTLVKTGTVVHTWTNVAPERKAYLELLDRVPAGARLFTVVFHDREPWSPLPEALEHLGSLAVRRGVFVPTMFVSPETPQPLVVRSEYRSLYRAGPQFPLSSQPDWRRVTRDYDYLLVARGEERRGYEIVDARTRAILYRLGSQQARRGGSALQDAFGTSPREMGP